MNDKKHKLIILQLAGYMELWNDDRRSVVFIPRL